MSRTPHLVGRGADSVGTGTLPAARPRIATPPSISNAPSIIDFPPFQLDLRAGQLRRGASPVPLRPKTFAVLQTLAERAGELMTKQALLDVVWRDVVVSEDVVRLSVGELRTALGDQRAAPRFIETVARRGYRFIARMGPASTLPGAAESAIDDAPPADGAVIGRARERAEIAEWLRAAASGQRRIGFVTGEAGIGKTTLVDTVLGDMRRTPEARLRIGRGQCVEHYGGGEPYLPVLGALTSLCRGSDGQEVKALLREHAPDWLRRVMGLLGPRQHDRADLPAGTHEHTLHKLAASLDALALETPLVLVLEDVHWSDYSTLDLLSIIAQGRDPMRLLVLCTLRPAEAIARGHPVVSVKRELRRKGLCREILLGGLSATDVASYLAARFAAADLPADLLPLLVDRSEGSPLFIVTLVDHLLEQGLLMEDGGRWQLRGGINTLRTAIPDELRAVIEPRLERLASEELRVLEAASVAGVEFSAHAVARVAPPGSPLGDVERVERLCDALVQRQDILRAAGEGAWPDGTASARYAFRHALYQQVTYQRLSSSSRRRLHQMIGEGLEAAHSGGTGAIASELAAHFERTPDVGRAVRYHGVAAARARSRSAYQEARFHLEAALDLLRSQPETPQRLQQEMPLLHDLGSTVFSIKGYGDEGAARAFARMRDLAERLDVPAMRLRAMDGLLLVRTMRAELTAARALGEEMIVLAEERGNPPAAARARVTLGATLFSLGEVEAARHQAERIRALVDPQARRLPPVFGISSCCLLASACAHLGFVARARAMRREALARSAKLDAPYFRAHATNFTAQVSTLLRDVSDARSLATETLHLSTEYGFSVFRVAATMVLGWCDVEEGRVDAGLAALREAFHEYTTTGQRISTTSFSLLLAGAHLASGDVAGANAAVDVALAFAAETGERLHAHELYRLKGECLLAGGTSRRKTEATEYFQRALAIAGERKAVLFELRAAASLFRVRTSAREQLARLVDRFGAEDDCADLRAARALLRRGAA
jgi:DNA-binding winged helix-turn-helix (wHTH) protein/tetratricopeptide (TPR) repeat protein